MEDHYLTFGTVFLGVISFAIFALGGVILFLTFQNWEKEKTEQKENQGQEKNETTKPPRS